MDNATVRGGAIGPRSGWSKLLDLLSSGLWQGGVIYNPIASDSNPYLVCSVGGVIYKAILDPPYTITNLSAQFGLFNPVTNRAYFCEGNGFLVIQAGDFGTGNTLPLFYASDYGAQTESLRRSNGIGLAVGNVASNFIVSAVGANNIVTLSGPYTGTVNEVVTIGSAQYVQVEPYNFYTVRNVSSGAIGATVPVGTQIFDTSGNLLATVIVAFVIPAVSSTVNIKATPGYTGAVPKSITINNESWSITSSGTVPPGANQVYLVNLTDTPGNTVTAPITIYAVNELPAAGPMGYYQARIWYAQGRKFVAGDIDGNQSSGTTGYDFADSVLKVTENPLAVGGDGFAVPTEAGNITAISFTANLDTALGQGPLYVFTAKQVYSLVVPVTRADWIAASSSNQPMQTVAQINNGAVGDRCVAHVNGDLFYQSLDPAIRSLIVATRYFNQWGNVGISSNEQRALQFNDRSLMSYASGIQFDNRLLQTILPMQTASGVVFQGIAPLDFDLVSTLQQRSPPSWEGVLEGVDILQLLTGDFGGLDRAFAVVVSREDQSIDVWELSTNNRTDNAGTAATSDNRINWYIESPAYTWVKEFELKQLHGGEIWLDRVFGSVDVTVYWRPDASPCWNLWHKQTMCVARSCAEDINNPCAVPYPNPATYTEGYKFPLTLPEPNTPGDPMLVRPATIGYQHQVKIVIKGFARIRGIMLYSEIKERNLYDGLGG